MKNKNIPPESTLKTMYAALAFMWFPYELFMLPALKSPIHSFNQQSTNFYYWSNR